MRWLFATLVLCALLAAASAAAAPNPSNEAALDRTVRYLQEAQQDNGGFGAAGEPSQISSAWTALALAAAGINPQDQARVGGVDAYSFLVSHYQEGIEESECAPITCTTTFERELMVVNASGTSPHDFAGVDLVNELLSRVRSDGAFPHVPGGQPGVNDTVFAILALAPVQEASAQAPIQRAADWVETAQQDDGSWSWKDRDAPGEVDMTGAAIQALIAAGRGGDEAVEKGLDYLHAAQNPEGGFPEFPGNPESNVASTAWAVQAIWAAGQNPEAWRTHSGEETEEPLDYMESLQEDDGHIRWKRSQDLNGVWMTAYTTPAFTGQNWPIPAAPRAISQSAAPPRGGQGEGTQAGDGVIAGGGSSGAPLFARPKPQSKGKTPGGARVVHNENKHPINHSKTRRGSNAKQSSVTVAAEPSRKDESTAGSPTGSTGADSGTRGKSGNEGSAGKVTGTLVGASAGTSEQAALAFGAPGLHSAGADPAGTPWAAIAITAAALLLGLAGAQLERRRGEAFA